MAYRDDFVFWMCDIQTYLGRQASKKPGEEEKRKRRIWKKQTTQNVSF